MSYLLLIGVLPILISNFIPSVQSQTVVAAGIGAAISGTCGWQTKCPMATPCCSVSFSRFDYHIQ